MEKGSGDCEKPLVNEWKEGERERNIDHTKTLKTKRVCNRNRNFR